LRSAWQEFLADGRHSGTGILPVVDFMGDPATPGRQPVPRACRKILPHTLRTCVCALAIAVSGLPAAAVAQTANEILRTLLTVGVPLGDGQTVKLPQPTLADRMTAAAQRQQIEALAEGRNSWEDLTRRTVVAPFVLRSAESGSEQAGPARRVDLWFVAYGSLETLAGDDFLGNQFKAASEDAENASSARLLSDADLKKRGLPPPSAAEDPRYVAAETTLLERVRISATTRSIKTRTAESLLAASILDPRFAGDPEFPNRWQSILRDDTGSRRLGESHVYSGLGSYVKATRLVEPQGALLIEYHVAYAEPQAWFNGANLLQSKLPILAQTVVRKLRRSLATP